MCHPSGSIVQKTGEERSFNNKKPAGNTKNELGTFFVNLALLEKIGNWTTKARRMELMSYTQVSISTS